jgi:hypothetical protein
MDLHQHQLDKMEELDLDAVADKKDRGEELNEKEKDD